MAKLVCHCNTSKATESQDILPCSVCNWLHISFAVMSSCMLSAIFDRIFDEGDLTYFAERLARFEYQDAH